MILLAHMIFGAAIGYKIYYLTNNIWLAAILVILSHYFLDIFPHIEYLESVEDSMQKIKNNGWQSNIKDILKVILDFFIGILLIFIFSKNYIIVYLYAMLAIIPDGLTFISNILLPSNKLLLKHNLFHEKIHFLKHKKISKFWRVLTQFVAVIVSIILFQH